MSIFCLFKRAGLSLCAAAALVAGEGYRQFKKVSHPYLPIEMKQDDLQGFRVHVDGDKILSTVATTNCLWMMNFGPTEPLLQIGRHNGVVTTFMDHPETGLVGQIMSGSFVTAERSTEFLAEDIYTIQFMNFSLSFKAKSPSRPADEHDATIALFDAKTVMTFHTVGALLEMMDERAEQEPQWRDGRLNFTRPLVQPPKELAL